MGVPRETLRLVGDPDSPNLVTSKTNIEQYRGEHVPLIVPVTLLNHYIRKYKQPYLAQQVYLNPHPIALKLRNHV